MAVTTAVTILIAGGAAALLYSGIRSAWVGRQPVDHPAVEKIAGFISEGAMAFLRREFSVLIPFVLVVALFLALGNQHTLRFQALSFALGAGASALAGYVGMRVAVRANARTASAAVKSLGDALGVAFAGGSVMGLTVVGLAMLGVGLVLGAAGSFIGMSAEILAVQVFPILSGFSLGASSVALFARVGGGIFTKAADVGADLVGKVEAGIPEDDHRNPATIADNVGDNVGDVAGMGADLFESYVGSLVGAMILGVSYSAAAAEKIALASFPMLLAVIGMAASVVGIMTVRVRGERSAQQALNIGSLVAGVLAILVTAGAAAAVFRGMSGAHGLFALRVAAAATAGMIAGTAIGFLTQYFTGTGTYPVRRIVRACETGPATTMITGMGVGMLSSFPSIVVIVAAIFGGFALFGLYGVAIAAIGMLMTIGIQLAVDAYGPIADNAGGLAEMAELPPSVRHVTDELDSVGNTTAAIGKGFAIGSAALTAIILFSAFQAQVGVPVVDLLGVHAIGGVLLGAVIPYLFSSMSMSAIGDAAYLMIEEVRRQFREMPGILDESEQPDYRRCVDISTSAALRKMLLPGAVAILTPVAVGFIGGVEMLAGVLLGVTASGVVLAIFMANSGGAWDNAKKMIEAGGGDGTGSEAHKAAVVGDTVGDPFKDTAGPSINILIKLMAIISLVLAPMLKHYWGL